MRKSFSMEVQNVGNDIFLNLSGAFDSGAAWQLADTILTRFHGSGKIFIDIRDLSVIMPSGADMIVNLVPVNLVGKKNVLIRDYQGVHSGLHHFRTLSESEKKISEEIPYRCFSAASIR